MKIFICGACGVGKRAIAQRAAEQEGNIDLRVDVSEDVFGGAFNRPLNHVLARRKWFGDAVATYRSLSEYLERLAEKPKGGRALVFNEGPSMLISHLLWFGPLYNLPTQQRLEVITKAFGLLGEGTHVFIEGWKKDTFNQATTQIQKTILGGQANVVYAASSHLGYNAAISEGVVIVLNLVRGVK